MTKVQFETAGLADVLRVVERIAPTRGQAFDKAAGIVIRVFPEGESTYAIIEATNLELYYREWVPVLECNATRETAWRVAAKISRVVSSLPIGSGKTVTLSDEEKPGGRTLTVLSGRTKNNWQLLPIEYYPEWETFDPDGLTEIEGFGARLEQVEWAASSNDADIPANGVNFNGEHVVATDSYKLARVPMPFHADWLKESITLPTRLLSSIIKQAGTIRVGATDTQLLIMPDTSKQIRTVIYAVPYAFPVDRIVALEHDGYLEAPKSALLDVLSRAMLLLEGDRFPMFDLFIGKGEVAVHAVNEGEGSLGDILEVPGYADHPRINYIITPRFLIDAVEKCPSDRIQLHYSTTVHTTLLRVSSGGGYDCWIVPRRNRPKAGEEPES